MKILLAADGSEHSRRAAAFLVANVKAFANAPEIHLLNVHAPIPYARAAAVAGADSVNRYHEEECKKALAVAEGVLAQGGLKYQSSRTAGEAPAEIAAYAAKHGIDLIVMGSHGRSALGNLALGSVATGVLAATKLPVTIIR
jgi:nucleotide-binding universal stress UspA family protein